MNLFGYFSLSYIPFSVLDPLPTANRLGCGGTMTNGIIGEFRIGEDIAIALDAVDGDAATITTIEVAM
jgi:hypothetical protein